MLSILWYIEFVCVCMSASVSDFVCMYWFGVWWVSWPVDVLPAGMETTASILK